MHVQGIHARYKDLQGNAYLCMCEGTLLRARPLHADPYHATVLLTSNALFTTRLLRMRFELKTSLAVIFFSPSPFMFWAWLLNGQKPLYIFHICWLTRLWLCFSYSEVSRACEFIAATFSLILHACTIWMRHNSGHCGFGILSHYGWSSLWSVPPPPPRTIRGNCTWFAL